jgi:hypothetical protein
MLHHFIVRSALALADTRFVTIEFIKKDGSIRTINGLLKTKAHLANTHRSAAARQRIAQSGLVPIWSPREGWKSFRPSSVVSIRAEGMDLTVKGA